MSEGDGTFARRHPALVRTGLFVALFGFATWVHFVAPESAAQSVSQVVNVSPAASVINALSPQAEVGVAGLRLGNAQTALEVKWGCDGLDILLIVLAAVLVYPMPLRRKLLGMLLGGSLIYLVNLARIVGLWYCLRDKPEWFDTMHQTVGQTVLILSATGFFAAYSGLLDAGRERRTSGAAT